MQRFWPTAPLRSYLFAIALLACAPLALLMTGVLVWQAQQQEAQRRQALDASVLVLAHVVEGELRAHAEGLALLAATGFAQRLADAGGADTLPPDPRLVRRGWHSLFLQDAAGNLLPGYPDMRGSADAAGNGFRVGPITPWPDGRLFVAVSVDAGAGWRLGAWVPAAVWQEQVAALARPAQGQSAIYDQRLHLVASSRDARPEVGQPLLPALAAAVRAQPAGGDGEPVDGERTAWRQLQLADLQSPPWGVRVALEQAPANRAALLTVLPSLTVAAICLLLGTWLSQRLARSVTRPLAALARGDIDGPAVASSIDELVQLRSALADGRNREADAVRRLEQQVQEFEDLFEISPVAMSLSRHSSREPWRDNEAMRQLLNFNMPGSVVNAANLPVMLQGGVALMPDERPLRMAANDGQVQPQQEQEWRFPPPNGSKWVLVQARPLLDAAGQPRGAVEAVMDITALKLAQQRLSQMHEQLKAAQTLTLTLERDRRHAAEEAVRGKDELLLLLGHELRNPLNALSAAAQVLQLVNMPDPLAVAAAAVVDRQSRQMTRMTNELLDMTRATEGRLSLSLAPLDLNLLAQSVVREFRDSVPLPQLRTSDQVAWIQADRDRIEQVVAQLLRGAVKSAAPGSPVWLTVAAQPVLGKPWVLLEIGRDGNGAPAPGEGWGSGPTLALEWASRLVQMHGGQLQWNSGGTTGPRTVQLRFAAAAAPLASAAPQRAAPGGAAVARTLLVVEDNFDAAMALRHVLEIEGHRVHQAADGEGGLQILLGHRPEAAIVDIGLPGFSGFELARRARAGGYSGLLVALSGFDAPQDARHAHKAGFDAYFVKPLDFTRLRELLATA